MKAGEGQRREEMKQQEVDRNGYDAAVVEGRESRAGGGRGAAYRGLSLFGAGDYMGLGAQGEEGRWSLDGNAHCECFWRIQGSTFG